MWEDAKEKAVVMSSTSKMEQEATMVLEGAQAITSLKLPQDCESNLISRKALSVSLGTVE